MGQNHVKNNQKEQKASAFIKVVEQKAGVEAKR
jgi:hypothetical protein